MERIRQAFQEPELPDGDARLYPPPTVLDSSGKALPAEEQLAVEQTFAQDAPRRMRPADQLPLDQRVEILEQIVDELVDGKRRRSEYMKQYMRDRRARDGA